MSHEDDVFGFSGFFFFWNQVLNFLNELKKLQNTVFSDVMCCKYMCKQERGCESTRVHRLFLVQIDPKWWSIFACKKFFQQFVFCITVILMLHSVNTKYIKISMYRGSACVSFVRRVKGIIQVCLLVNCLTFLILVLSHLHVIVFS